LPKSAESGNIVAKNGNNVEATFDFVERIVRLVALDNVASTLLLVWMELKAVWWLYVGYHDYRFCKRLVVCRLVFKRQSGRFDSLKTVLRINHSFSLTNNTKFIMYNNDQHHKMFMYAQIRPISSFLEYNTTNDEKKCKHRIAGSLAAYNKNSSEDEIANVNVLRRHRACRGQSLRPLN